MQRIIFTVQCDVCGEFFERLATCSTADQNSCALLAGGVIEDAESHGWFFNSKTRQVWCADCLLELSSNANMPEVSSIRIPNSVLSND